MSEDLVYHVPGTAIDTICHELDGALASAVPITSPGPEVVNVQIIQRTFERCRKLKDWEPDPEHTESVNFIAWKSFPLPEGGEMPPLGALLCVRRIQYGVYVYEIKRGDADFAGWEDWMVLEVDFRREEA
ncbi:MAG: hypothetical protein OES69_02425 [Myxococcales bacterium]|nr:hypothetical protein [Myxococcales bacterium]